MKYLIDILKGVVIGVANAIPGVSGGTMMVSMGTMMILSIASRIYLSSLRKAY